MKWYPDSITELFILATIVVWVVYDVAIYIFKGNAATESATTWRFAYTLPSIPWLVGILLGHLFFQQHAPSAQALPGWQYLWIFQIAVLLLSVVWLGFDLYQYNKVGTCCDFSNMIWTVTGHRAWAPLALGIVIGMVFFQMHDPTSFMSRLRGAG
jgi:hypothetical protein